MANRITAIGRNATAVPGFRCVCATTCCADSQAQDTMRIHAHVPATCTGPLHGLCNICCSLGSGVRITERICINPQRARKHASTPQLIARVQLALVCRRNDSVNVRDDQGTELDAIAESAVDVCPSEHRPAGLHRAEMGGSFTAQHLHLTPMSLHGRRLVFVHRMRHAAEAYVRQLHLITRLVRSFWVLRSCPGQCASRLNACMSCAGTC